MCFVRSFVKCKQKSYLSKNDQKDTVLKYQKLVTHEEYYNKVLKYLTL